MHLLACNRFQAKFAFICVFSFAIFAIPSVAHAASLSNTLGASICQLVNMMTGITGRSVATLAVMFLGIGSFFGKANWGLVLTVACGIVIIFGAADLAEGLGITGATTACPAAATAGALDLEVGTALCTVAAAVNGNVGRALSSLAVLFVGVASFFGKASWQLVITTVCGIAILNGAAEIVHSLAISGGWEVTGDTVCLPSLKG